jgi:sugar-specific transcriptional regulator TrmB
VTESTEQLADRLSRLGFSQYEARTYIGLLLRPHATGYTLANETGVPQPKVYETLRRLVERGAAVQSGSRPARYAAVDPGQLMDTLENDFRVRLAAAREGLERLPMRGGPGRALPVAGFAGFRPVVDRAQQAIDGARERIYLHGRADELRPLAGAVGEAAGRGVQFVIVHFGPLPFPKPPGRVQRHVSTEGTLYASRQARHLAAVVDSRWALWAVARDGEHWEGLEAELPLLASLVKSFVRHDLFVQRIYAEAPEPLEALYGPGLLELADLSSETDQAGEAAG